MTDATWKERTESALEATLGGLVSRVMTGHSTRVALRVLLSFAKARGEEEDGMCPLPPLWDGEKEEWGLEEDEDEDEDEDEKCGERGERGERGETGDGEEGEEVAESAVEEEKKATMTSP